MGSFDEANQNSRGEVRRNIAFWVFFGGVLTVEIGVMRLQKLYTPGLPGGLVH
jgi:hypothetical protein